MLFAVFRTARASLYWAKGFALWTPEQALSPCTRSKGLCRPHRPVIGVLGEVPENSGVVVLILDVPVE